MTTDSEKEGRKTVKEHFNRKIASTKDLMNEYKSLSQTVESRNESTAMKAFYASVYIASLQHVETLEFLDGLVDSLFDLNHEIRAKILSLDETVRNSAENTGADLSTMKTEFANMQEAIAAPIYKYIKTQQADEEGKKKTREELLDWVLRSR
jgi:hypothetical protein